MISCDRCGRWVTATNWERHRDYHDAQLLLDHTGPHGTCLQNKVAPNCSCPDPVYSGGTAVCTCCDGTVNVAQYVTSHDTL